ncbi:proline-rich domain-containing protein [Saccharothrix australiensis]|uniref:Uncharacterized protein n=1 Tax=Saccharothrix australiensis TaxID=2072 RepID=A0A495W814_9PSEU|nr:proline-rich domain-containing protein [Saccharothrix australiensis]RKT57901.1 hypothetical protein C8E97_6633 [Saccharothrix australiensis]
MTTPPHDPYGQQGGYQQQPGGQFQPGHPQQGHPQQGHPQQGYPQQPGYPPQAPPLSPGELNRPARPKSVDTAFLLWMIGAGVGIVSTIFSFLTAEALAKATAEKILGRDVDSQLVASAEPSYGSAIFSLVLFALWIVVVFQMRNGANWARIVLTVLGALGILGGLFGLFAIGLLFSIGFLGAIQALLSVVQLVITIGALVFMFKSDANYYFKAS